MYKKPNFFSVLRRARRGWACASASVGLLLLLLFLSHPSRGGIARVWDFPTGKVLPPGPSLCFLNSSDKRAELEQRAEAEAGF